MKKNKIIVAIVAITMASALSAMCGMGSMSGSKSKGSSMGGMKCGGMMGSMGSSSGKEHDMSMEEDPASYKVAKRYCTQCHYLKEKNTHNSSQWQPTLNRMYTYMQNQNLMVPMEDEKDAIEKYYGISK